MLPFYFKVFLDKGAVMRDASGTSREPSQDSFFEDMDSVFLSLPHARELAEIEVSFDRSPAVVSSGNILPFRRNQLTDEERAKLLATLAD